MSKPNVNHDNPLLGAFIEITSAVSALNMEPTPLPVNEVRGPYLSDRDQYAKHATEHLSAASQNVANISVELHKIHEIAFKSGNHEILHILQKLI
jgi:hypothetical protein